MDKLKENKFWIGAIGTGLLLVGLVFWLIYLPMSELLESQDALAKNIRTLEKAERWEFLPTEARWKHLRAESAAEVEALNRGIHEYDTLGKRFQEYFDDAVEPPQVSDFGARYQVEFGRLIDSYQKKFQIQASDPGAPATASGDQGDLPPRVNRIQVGQLDEERLPVAMKEFWIAQSVIQTCEELDLGGLQEVEFLTRDSEHKDSAETHAWRSVRVDIDLPYSQAENLLTDLLTVDRVRFRVQSLDIQKSTASLAAHKSLVIEEEFEQYSEAKAKSYMEVAPEPDVKMQLVLDAFDWKGMQPEELKSAADDEGKSKSRRKRRRNRKK
jgi:hypothetical protein